MRYVLLMRKIMIEILKTTRKYITYRIHLIDGDIELKVNKIAWKDVCDSLQKLSILTTRNELGKRLIKYTDFNIGRDGIFTGIDFLLKIGARPLKNKSHKFKPTVIRRRK